MNTELPTDSTGLKRPAQLGLRWKMLIGFGSVIVVMMTIFGLVMLFGMPLTSYDGFYGQQQSEVLRNLGLVADLKKERLEFCLRERKADLIELSEDFFVANSLNEILTKVREKTLRGESLETIWINLRKDPNYQGILQRLRQIAKTSKAYEKIQIADAKTGLVVAASKQEDLGLDVSRAPAFVGALNSGYGGASEVQADRPTGRPYLVLSQTIQTPSKEDAVGVSAMGVALFYIASDSYLQPLLYTGGGLGKTGEIILVNYDSKILIPLKHLAADGTVPKVLDFKILSESALLAVRGKEGARIGNDYRGVPVLGTYRHIPVTPDQGWGMEVKRDQAEVFAPLRQGIGSAVLIGLISIAACFALVSVVAARISLPIQKLSAAAEKVAGHDFSVRVPVSTSDEVGILARTFNTMLDRIERWNQELEGQIRSRTVDLEEMNERLLAEISDHKKTEQAVKQSEERYRSLIAHLPQSIFIKDLNSVYLSCNANYGTQLGITPDQIVGKDDFAFHSFELAHAYRANDQSCMSAGMVKDFEEPYQLAGQERWAHTIKVPYRNAEGEIIGVLGICEDITDRKMAEKELETTVKRFHTILSSLYAGVLVVAEEGHVEFANQAFCNLFDIDDLPENLQGLGPTETIQIIRDAYANPADAVRRIQAIVAQGHPVKGEEIFIRNRRVYLRDYIPIIIDGKRYGRLWYHRDITERKRTEEFLRDSEQRFRNLFEQGPLGIAVIGLDYRFVTVNTALCEMVGYTGEELTKLKFTDITHSGDIEADVFNAEKLRRGEVSFYKRQKRYRKKNGEFLWIQVTVSIVRDEQGRGLYFLSMFEDISERKRTEDDLKKLYLEKNLILNSAWEGIFGIDRNGNHTFVNPSAARMLGYEIEELIGRHSHSTWHHSRPDGKPYPAEDCPIYATIRDGKLHHARDEVFWRKDGSTFLTECMSAPIVSGDEIAGAVVSFFDVTEPRKAKKELEETRERLELALNGADMGLWDWHLQSNAAFLNERGAEIVGYSSKEIEPKFSFWESLLHPDDKPGFLKKVFDHLAGFTDSYEDNYRVRHKSGDWKWILSRGKITERDGDGNPVRMTGTFLDITERKSSEEREQELTGQLLQAQKMEAVGNLAGGIAHDFNNILQVVLGYSELLLIKMGETAEGSADVEKINNAGKRGADLVQNLMMFSRKVQPNFRLVNLNDEAVQIQKLLSRTIPKTIKINANLSGELELVEADISQIGQVLMNLAVNARDAMPEGGTLNIETKSVWLHRDYCAIHPDLKPGIYVLLEVSDTGIGMDEETLSHIFEPFFTTKDVGKGTGLGLATVYGIVKQHKGHVTCHSEVGKGTVFKIYLPAVEQKLESDAQESKTPILGGTETILLVDDEEPLRDLGATILSRYGYQVLTAENGREALETYLGEREKISLIVLDLIMPEMDGKKCLAELLNINPKANVLIASGHSEGILAMESSLPGAKGLVAKPYQMKKLLQAVREVLDAVG